MRVRAALIGLVALVGCSRSGTESATANDSTQTRGQVADALADDLDTLLADANGLDVTFFNDGIYPATLRRVAPNGEKGAIVPLRAKVQAGLLVALLEAGRDAPFVEAIPPTRIDAVGHGLVRLPGGATYEVQVDEPEAPRGN